MRIGFITSNKGKLLELQTSLSLLGHEVVRVPISYPELQADTLDEVAQFGLSWIMTRLNERDLSDLPGLDEAGELDLVIIEDSGLFIHGLGGFPGVYSKYVFQTVGPAGVLKLLKGNPDRSAHFESCICAGHPGRKKHEIIKGTCDGTNVQEPRGTAGFGFDPIFQPLGVEKTFAEMETKEKNSFSHRGNAVEKHIEWLEGEL